MTSSDNAPKPHCIPERTWIFFAIADALNHAGPNKIVQLVHISVTRQDSRDQNPGAFELPSLRNVEDFWVVGISSTELCEPEPWNLMVLMLVGFFAKARPAG